MNQKELLLISITVFFTIIAWMVLDIYLVKTRSGIKSESKQFQAVDFTINAEILEILKEKNP
ncbi:hypothetical protein A3C98_04335 [Candidatus Roizmanbacteria bacterium RIFCSPHIGHO2_02_FULL_37_15]|uniref:Uncharacterized protein n=1 Tax=Candidatus Roizmanbacteria bacterium RIFCSPLOWO2_01_FULL_37_16 TaxID=1802058 RepID=A0A1F7IIN4_9BACT|nr:MAG: hypothetical protein A2859_01075 [Candidatus Roizmanbacteria bacterium RIFCSPHIGHO2_01_FULL_37_16b]OGK20720.1 MAG: hypothetical protein A3C98_04335 [Candidatus Roizmanbacteria bacterium RIFCSPHIGHO2_02_FULL_37_15]OGK33311.1 MAG: hypothetical protein A3F57_05215 [Candidatus Roizmanbacteria bacterium RIFCSPHIGHO2_12_FULL_36_11]OGK43225.1 MAG: hypothetical protein A3B40_03100 [Candidatus Roizmanbacteria bacterium RIFCSPLOWO2_01_FULL_37_16]